MPNNSAVQAIDTNHFFLVVVNYTTTAMRSRHITRAPPPERKCVSIGLYPRGTVSCKATSCPTYALRLFRQEKGGNVISTSQSNILLLNMSTSVKCDQRDYIKTSQEPSRTVHRMHRTLVACQINLTNLIIVIPCNNPWRCVYSNERNTS
jgi:hypothetical protein